MDMESIFIDHIVWQEKEIGNSTKNHIVREEVQSDMKAYSLGSMSLPVISMIERDIDTD